jgi:hypothetical protein
MKRSLNLVSSILKAPCNDLARGFFLSATRLFYRIALIYYQFTFGDTKRWTEGPARLIGEEPDGETVIDLQANREVCESTFRSLSRNMPYMGLKFSAWPLPAGR